MKQHKQYLTTIFSGIGMLILVLDSKTALRAASDGVALCIQAVIPSLFPFFFLSMFLSSGLNGLHTPLLRPIETFCRIPAGTASIFLTGFLGGYPVGAKCIADSVSNGQLSTKDGQRMLGFCNNAGPAFLFGMGSTLFENPIIPWVVWVTQLFSALLTAYLLPGKPENTCTSAPKATMTLPKALQQSIVVMTNVCGWVMLFRIMIVFFERWFSFLLPNDVFLFLSGILELSNGCLSLPQITSIPLRILLFSLFIHVGGLCVALQTISVTDKLGTGLYFPGKLLQCLISTFFIMIYLHCSGQKLLSDSVFLALILFSFIFFVLLVCLRRKKDIAIPDRILYNRKKSVNQEDILCSFVRKCPVPVATAPTQQN